MKQYIKQIEKAIKQAQIEEFYKPSDKIAIERLAQLMELRDVLQASINELGVVLVNENSRGGKTYLPNPSIVQMDKVDTQIRQYLVQLYLTPKARDEKFKKAENVVKVKTHDDIIDELLSGLDL